MKPSALLLQLVVAALVIMGLAAPAVLAQETTDEHLAKELANPVARLISVPFQFNRDGNVGPARNGHKLYLNVQPVIPFGINDDWNLVSRTILPMVDQHVPLLGDGNQSGICDITQSFFFSPSQPNTGGIIWGAGPALLIPSDTDFISAKKWGLGPTAVVLQQQHAWTQGIIANHIWSVGGSGPQELSNTFLQPFLSYTTKDAWTFGLNTESVYDWKQSQWTVPVNATVAKLTSIGKQRVSIGGGLRYYVDSPETGPHGWGLRDSL